MRPYKTLVLQLCLNDYKNMRKIIQNNKLQIIFALLGALGGYLYWKFVGCLSGTCPIKSVWYWSTLWGTAVGYLLGDFINSFIKRKQKEVIKDDERKIQ